MIRVTTLILIAYVFSSRTLECLDFYDSELKRMCLTKIRDNILELCNSTNCLIIDEMATKKGKRIAFVIFRGQIDRDYSIFTKGKKFINRKYSEAMSEDSCKQNIQEIVNEIKVKYKIKRIDIYFTIQPCNIETSFFHNRNLKVCIDLIKDCLKQVTDSKTSVEYFPYEYQKCLEGRILQPSCSSVGPQLLIFQDSGKKYVVFLNKLALQEMLGALESFFISHMQEIMSKVKVLYKAEENPDLDICVLSVFLRMNGEINENIYDSQVNFLLGIWEYLIRKNEFKKLFEDIFDKEIQDGKKKDLGDAIRTFVQEYKNFLMCEGVFFFEDEFHAKLLSEKCSLLMNATMSHNMALNKSSRVFVIRVFSVLIHHFKSLTRIVLSGSCLQTNMPDTLFKQTRGLFRQVCEDLILGFFEYLKPWSKYERIGFFDDLTDLCLRTLRKDKMEILVIKKFEDKRFKEYAKSLSKKE